MLCVEDYAGSQKGEFRLQVRLHCPHGPYVHDFAYESFTSVYKRLTAPTFELPLVSEAGAAFI